MTMTRRHMAVAAALAFGASVLLPCSPSSAQSTDAAAVAEAVKNTFEISPAVQVLERGSLAAEFERSLKAPRFVDRRQ